MLNLEESLGKKDKPAGPWSFHRALAKWSRWLHIYLSMISLAAILFFSVTGVTLNHPDWFFREDSRVTEGSMDVAWLHLKTSVPENWDGSDFGHEIDKLAVAEHLRQTHLLTGQVADFLCFEDSCEVTFQGPGYAATARIMREDGKYVLTTTCNDLVSIMNDLHKGRHTGAMWKVVIDVSAITLALVAISGFVLVFYLRLKRSVRVVISILGTILFVWFIRQAMIG
jgi:uncharacterized protein